MLGKVLKYDIKASAKMFLPMYLIVIVVSVLTLVCVKVLGEVENQIADFVGGTTILMYVVALIALMILTSIFLIVRFYKNFATDEAYLTFTLPVKTSSLVISKQINGIFWNLISIVVFGAALFIVLGEPLIINLDSVKWYLTRLFLPIYAELRGLSIVVKVGMVLMIVLPFIFNLTNIYASIAMGQMYTRHKVRGAVLAYIGLYIAQSMFTNAVMAFVANAEAVEPVVICMVLIQLVTGIAHMVITYYFLKNKLNLE